ncbi:MAG: hypothetical protein B7Y89_15975 [Novosphingobium sp. 32-60-15]|nr:MAG: hypothetical protein B7Y89_15975 [Novosphingobium sp. 32-60-15]
MLPIPKANSSRPKPVDHPIIDNLVLRSWSREAPRRLQVIDDGHRLPRAQVLWQDDAECS